MRVSGMRNLYFVSKPRTSRGRRFSTDVVPNLYPQPLDTDPPRRISLGEKVHPLGNRPGPARTQRKVVLASGGALVTSVTHCLTRLPSRVDQQTAPSMGKQATFNIILGAALLAAPAAHIMSRHYCASPPPGTREAARMRLCTLHGVYRSQRAFSRLPAS